MTVMRSMDGKGRVMVPREIREALGVRFALTRGTGGVLAAFSLPAWRRRETEFGDSVAFLGFVVGGMVEREWSEEGRFMIPPELRAHAGLRAGTDVAISDVGRGVLLMRADRYREQLAVWEAGLVDTRAPRAV